MIVKCTWDYSSYQTGTPWQYNNIVRRLKKVKVIDIVFIAADDDDTKIVGSCRINSFKLTDRKRGLVDIDILDLCDEYIDTPLMMYGLKCVDVLQFHIGLDD